MAQLEAQTRAALEFAASSDVGPEQGDDDATVRSVLLSAWNVRPPPTPPFAALPALRHK
jgi:hypothetical protein